MSIENGAGVAGSMPLPAGGQQGNAFVANKMHPAALAAAAATPSRMNPVNAGPPGVAGGPK